MNEDYIEEDNMSTAELMKICIEEFTRIQQYLLLVDKNSEAYKAMHIRYNELKVILNSIGVATDGLDIIKN